MQKTQGLPIPSEDAITDIIEIDTASIPGHVRDSLSAATLEAFTRFLQQPGGRERLDARVEKLRKEGRLA
jgi:hypothetical protein